MDAHPDGTARFGATNLARNYCLAMLTLVYTLNFIDRQIVNIVAEPIKHDLGLSDSQLGLLTGLAFAVFYSILGIPIARFTERGHRPRILAVCLGVWSGFTLLCGLARSFPQLLFCRIGVAAGEAGCTPAAHSLISDSFRLDQRARALAIFALGSPLGGLAGLLLGGVVAGSYGWRAVFWFAGLPGLLLVPIVAFTILEPRARAAMPVRAATPPTIRETLAVLRGKPSFWLACLGSSGFALFSLAEGAFIASFYLRNHSAALSDLAASLGLTELACIGILLGLIMGIGGGIGSIVGGALADRFGRKSLSNYLVSPIAAALLLIPLHVVAILIADLYLSLIFLGATAICKMVFVGPTWATIQGVAPPQMRATAAALQLVLNNLIGLGLGPVLVGVLSDLFSTRLGLGPAEGLRYALLSLILVCLPVAGLYWAARRHVARDFHG